MREILSKGTHVRFNYDRQAVGIGTVVSYRQINEYGDVAYTVKDLQGVVWTVAADKITKSN